MFFSQVVDLGGARPYVIFLINVCVGYIMIEVGLEFVINKKRWRSYIKDYGIAALTAFFPWAFCFLYFFFFFSSNSWQELLLISRFAAPTSSGILFSMLAAVGLGTSWLFRKVQILAILDDVDTILLLIPLQFLLSGTRMIMLNVVFVIVLLVILAWRYLHRLRLPSGRIWIMFYSILFTTILFLLEYEFHVEMEILLPAFVFGCMLFNPHDPRRPDEHEHEHAFIEPEERPLMLFDRSIKVIFMVLVGLILPKIEMDSFNLWLTCIHVLAITILMNLGKCFPIFCYKDEAPLRERTAVCFGMFPRGEVGAGILVLAIEHGAGGFATSVAGIALALNLLLTGVFIMIVLKLVNKKHRV